MITFSVLAKCGLYWIMFNNCPVKWKEINLVLNFGWIETEAIKKINESSTGYETFSSYLKAQLQIYFISSFFFKFSNMVVF